LVAPALSISMFWFLLRRVRKLFVSHKYFK
jgi:hypothetical protein